MYYFGFLLDGAKAVTLKEVEEKINNLDKIEQTVEWLVKQFYSLKGNKSTYSISEVEEKLDNVTDNAMQPVRLTDHGLGGRDYQVAKYAG